MTACIQCDNPKVENRELMLCASCNTARRKSERLTAKEPKKRKAIPKVSAKRKEENKEYATLRKGFLRMHPKCQARLLGCADLSVDIHHASGRSGDNFLNVKTWLAVCRHCHSICHNKLSAQQRREKGLLVSFNSNEPHKI